jgi:hypothetical protein
LHLSACRKEKAKIHDIQVQREAFREHTTQAVAHTKSQIMHYRANIEVSQRMRVYIYVNARCMREECPHWKDYPGIKHECLRLCSALNHLGHVPNVVLCCKYAGIQAQAQRNTRTDREAERDAKDETSYRPFLRGRAALLNCSLI